MPVSRERLDEVVAPQPERKYRYARRKFHTRLDYDTIEAMCVEVARYGAPLSDLANAYAIDPNQLVEWKRRGEVYLQTQSPEEWELYGDFVAALRIAMGEYAVKTNRKIHKSDDWFRFLKIGERRMPETYGKDPQGGSDQVFNPDDKFL